MYEIAQRKIIVNEPNGDGQQNLKLKLNSNFDSLVKI